MNTKWLRIGCIMLSLILFLFAGWLRIKGDYRSMWKSSVDDMIDQYQEMLEELSEYGSSFFPQSEGIDKDVIKDVEKFMKWIRNGKLTPLEMGLIAPKIQGIMETMGAVPYLGAQLESVSTGMTVYMILFWVTVLCGVMALIIAFKGKGKVFNAIYAVGLVIIFIIFARGCSVANNGIGEKIFGTGFWPIVSLLLCVAALFIPGRSANTAFGASSFTIVGNAPSVSSVQGGQTLSQTWTCPACGAKQKEESRFCSSCGTPKPQPQPQPAPAAFCKYCGAKLQPGDQFCSECGSQING